MPCAEFRGRSILITGANGFIGTYLTEELVSKGAAVGAIGLPGLSFHTDVKPMQGDLRDASFVTSAVQELQPEFVFHLAAFKERTSKIEAFQEAIGTNVIGSLNLFTALVTVKRLRSVIVVGTAEEYGNGEIPFVERMREAPVSAYSLSKVCVTQLCNLLCRLYGLPTVVLRPTIAFGPRQSSDMFLPALIKAIVSDQPFQMTAGQQTRDYIFVTDVVDALLSCAVCDAAIGQIINIGGGVTVTIAELAMQVERMLRKTGLVQLGAIDYRPGEIMHYEVNIDKAKAVLGWSPQVNLVEGLRRTIEYYRTATQ